MTAALSPALHQHADSTHPGPLPRPAAHGVTALCVLCLTDIASTTSSRTSTPASLSPSLSSLTDQGPPPPPPKAPQLVAKQGRQQEERHKKEEQLQQQERQQEEEEDEPRPLPPKKRRMHFPAAT